VFSLLFLWLGAAAACAYEQAADLFSFMEQLMTIMEHPLQLHWTPHTLKFMLGTFVL